MSLASPALLLAELYTHSSRCGLEECRQLRWLIFPKSGGQSTRNGKETTMGDSTLLMERKRLRVSVWRRAGRNEYKFRLNTTAASAGSVFMSSSVIFLVLVEQRS
jgi:hypothetical protein